MLLNDKKWWTRHKNIFNRSAFPRVISNWTVAWKMITEKLMAETTFFFRWRKGFFYCCFCVSMLFNQTTGGDDLRRKKEFFTLFQPSEIVETVAKAFLPSLLHSPFALFSSLFFFFFSSFNLVLKSYFEHRCFRFFFLLEKKGRRGKRKEVFRCWRLKKSLNFTFFWNEKSKKMLPSEVKIER